MPLHTRNRRLQRVFRGVRVQAVTDVSRTPVHWSLWRHVVWEDDSMNGAVMSRSFRHLFLLTLFVGACVLWQSQQTQWRAQHRPDNHSSQLVELVPLI